MQPAGMMRAIVGALLGLTAATPTAWAQSYPASGKIGYLQEWEIAGSLAKAATRPADYSGTVTLRHIGLCSVNGVEQKQARMQLRVSSGRLEGTLIMDDDECRVVASGSSGSGLLTCHSGQDIPINLLIGKAVETETSDRVGRNP
ncbi:hypothetical protein [Bradyrhizobium iriomotense]|uniref:DUF3617 family protein n=1 Tax=Bradyrhizobium iriomotense TaxID=441950 RepID=A0ABQ6ARL8_9BRAD|nr:hypothetical protein [Bradyrhizobium iriomotense]GLR83554.1 hypothetical protein GCM10007857_02640 [Bradyrhizobium iriomotense]